MDNCLSPIDRFCNNIEIDETNGCWLWQNKIRPDGYARFKVRRKPIYVHRWAYNEFVGPVEEGLELDHLCSVRHCCNPEHPEAVTHKENCSRGKVNQCKGKTHCPQGHPYSGHNLVFAKSGARRCRKCINKWSREYQRRKRTMEVKQNGR